MMQIYYLWPIWNKSWILLIYYLMGKKLIFLVFVPWLVEIIFSIKIMFDYIFMELLLTPVKFSSFIILKLFPFYTFLKHFPGLLLIFTLPFEVFWFLLFLCVCYLFCFGLWLDLVFSFWACPGTHAVDQSGLKLTEIHLSLRFLLFLRDWFWSF